MKMNIKKLLIVAAIIAVLAVVAFHAYPKSIKGGFICVDIFFVISGYLISTIIFESLDRDTFSFSDFYARRVKRIFPALLLVLTTCLLFGWFLLLADEFNQLGKHITAGASFISNLVFWNEAGYFDNAADTKPLLHLWSLGIEEQFYVVWPLVLWLAWKKKFNPIIIIILLVIASFVFNIYLIKSDEIAAFYSPLTRFWELLSGSLLAWMALYKSEVHDNIRNKIDSCLNFIFYKKK
jgi:peptidoglycan/LPS O-acetylase OafA/YrhL